MTTTTGDSRLACAHGQMDVLRILLSWRGSEPPLEHFNQEYIVPLSTAIATLSPWPFKELPRSSVSGPRELNQVTRGSVKSCHPYIPNPARQLDPNPKLSQSPPALSTLNTGRMAVAGRRQVLACKWFLATAVSKHARIPSGSL